MEFRKNSNILPKILIHKEVVIFSATVQKMTNSDKMDRGFWLNFQQLFCC